MSVTLVDLGMSYRKAKVDLYYTTSPSLFAIADYEENLELNLRLLLEKINGDDSDWVQEDEFLGGYTFLPTAIKEIPRFSDVNELKVSAPAAVWTQIRKKAAAAPEGSSRPVAEFRLTAQCSLDFHVLSTLWLLKVGHKFESRLTDSAYGNRLRRRLNGEINDLSLGSFSPYMGPFRTWRDNGLAAMTKALDGDKKVIAITADVSSFYHELDPRFMLDEDFTSEVLGLDLSDFEQKLHRLFINALTAWSASTPLGRGLPVGLPASAVIANMALIELDRLMEREVVPLYYGRYVDDIMLVMENGAGFTSPDELWKWLFRRSDGMLSSTRGEDGGVRFQTKYLQKSNILFANEKNKIFLLEGVSGRVLVDSIARQVRNRASEWRSLANLPKHASSVATDMVAATQLDGEAADNLRKTDSLTMRRAGFALQLRDLEAYERDLEPAAWLEHRLAFYKAFVEHVLVLPNFFELATYLNRVIRLATSCKDFEQLAEIVSAVVRLFRTVGDECHARVKAATDDELESSRVVEIWTRQVKRSVHESVVSAFPESLSQSETKRWSSAFSSPELLSFNRHGWAIARLKREHKRLFLHDLAASPFRFALLPKELVSQRGLATHPSSKNGDFANLLKSEVLRGLKTIVSWTSLRRPGTPIGLAFHTRPFTLAELYIVAEEPFGAEAQEDLGSVLLSLRGFSLLGKMPYLDETGDPVLMVDSAKQSDKKRIALGSWKTTDESWTASVTQREDPDRDRYRRLNMLVNEAISQSADIDYLILPELALPAKWFMRIAQKLQARGISLVAGIEYLHLDGGGVRNQVWAALSHDGLGFPSMMIYKQDKQRLALHEEQELQRLAGKHLDPTSATHPLTVIRHGDFSFAMLVCSELTNIEHRAKLRGRIDALFVPEWNRDTTTFEALVESAALDIHAYVIQCNDREYGDSRIRAPYSEVWKRDIVKIKGGTRDYVVIGDIDVTSLRQFQSSHRSAPGPFKPMPDGFFIAPERSLLPVRA